MPRPMATLGLIAGALLCASGAAVLLGVLQQDGVVRTIATMPEFFWELLLGIYLTRQSAIVSSPTRTASKELVAAV